MYDIKPEFIWNTDETGNNPLPGREVVLAPDDGSKPVAELPQSSEHRTFIPFVSASGEFLKPTVIFPLKTAPNLDKQLEAFFNITGSKTSFVNGALFQTIVENWFVQEMNQRRKNCNSPQEKVLLIMDNHSSRESLDREKLWGEHGIYVLFLPPHTSALLQPLDLSVNGTFKSAYRSISRKMDKESLTSKPDIRYVEMLSSKRAFSVALTEDCIKTGWERAGLHPCNFQVFAGNEMISTGTEGLSKGFKGGRGPQFDNDGVLVNGNVMLHKDRVEAIQPKKKQRKE